MNKFLLITTVAGLAFALQAVAQETTPPPAAPAAAAATQVPPPPPESLFSATPAPAANVAAPTAAPATADAVASAPANAADVFGGQEPKNPVLVKGYLSPTNEWNTSIMFPPSAMHKLRQIIQVSEENRSFFNSDNTDDSVNDLLKWEVGGSETGDATKRNPAITEFPAFYLASIVIYKDHKWSVWLNNHRISSDANNEQSEIYIKSVSEKKVEVVWRPQMLEKITSGWNPGDVEKLSGATGDVSLDKQKSTIRFTLLPNQTFDSKQAMVKEGKVAPTLVMKAEGGDILFDKNNNALDALKTTTGPDSAKKAETGSTMADANPGAPKDPEVISQELIEQYKKIGKFIPKK